LTSKIQITRPGNSRAVRTPRSDRRERLPLRGAVGVVDRLDERYGDHLVVVRFPTVIVPPFGHAWVDAFAPDEVVRAEP
jgi:hypothetical protein